MKAAVREPRFHLQPAWVLAAACAACPSAWSQAIDSAPADMVAAAGASDGAARLQVSATRFPRIEGLDSATSGTRLDLTMLPPRRSAVGVAFGMSGFEPPPAIAGQPAAASLNFDLGVHWRHTTDANYQVDLTAWRRMNTQPDAYTMIQQRLPSAYVARVELNLNGQRRGLVADRGFLGLQLESGARIGLRRKDGGTMVYYRVRF